MTPNQIMVVQQTWRKVEPIADAAATMFYDRLFELDAEVRSLFSGTDQAIQRMKLMKALGKVIGALNHVDSVVPEIQAMGRRHVKYGVRDADYDTVGTALLWTLEQGLGQDWTPEAKDAWTSAYGLVANTMKSAAATDAA